MPRPRTFLSLAAGLVIAALVLPFVVNVNRYRFRIARELQEGLGRRVEVGSVRLKLFSGPGFDLTNVVITEDPAFGIEPFARVPKLRATLRLRSLWTGKLQFSSLVFEDASINLARAPAARWNVESLISRAGGASRAALRAQVPMPYIELQDARINFKTGDTKTRFFLSGVDASVFRKAGSPRLNVRLSGAPARTDRTLTDVGDLHVEGSFATTENDPDRGMRLDVSLADAYLSDVLSLASGGDHGIHGLVQMRASVEGEWNALHAAGTMRLAEVHRWDMLPPDRTAGIDVRFDSIVDAPAGSVEVKRFQADLGAGSLVGAGVIRNLLGRPDAHARFVFSGARVDSVVAAVAHFTSRPAAFSADGVLDGDLSVDALPLRVRGYVLARDVKLLASGMPAATAASSRINFIDTTATVEPAELQFDDGSRLDLTGQWDWDAGRATLAASGRQVPFSNVAALAEFAGMPATPAGFSTGPETRVDVNVQADFRPGARPRIGGWAQLMRLRWMPPGLSTPVTLHTARFDFLSDQVRATRMVASWAGATITGSVRVPLRPGVIAADVHVNEVNVTALGNSLRPRSSRMPILSPGAWAAAAAAGSPTAALVLGTATALPDDAGPARWRVEGRLSVDRLVLRRLELGRVQGAFRVAGAQLQLTPLSAECAGGQWQGTARLDFGGMSPAFSIDGRIRDVALGRLAALTQDFEGAVEGSAAGTVHIASSGWETPEVLQNLKLSADLEGKELRLRNIDLESGGSAEGRDASQPSRIAQWTATLTVEQGTVKLERCELHAPGGILKAAGTVAFDRTADILFEPGAGSRLTPFRLTGPLPAPQTRRVAETRAP